MFFRLTFRTTNGLGHQILVKLHLRPPCNRERRVDFKSTDDGSHGLVEEFTELRRDIFSWAELQLEPVARYL